MGHHPRRVDYHAVLTRGTRVEHPLLVLRALPPAPSACGRPRCGVVAGKRLGGAVVRNRARRRTRAALRDLLAAVAAPWGLVALLKAPAGRAEFRALREACAVVLWKAGVLDS